MVHLTPAAQAVDPRIGAEGAIGANFFALAQAIRKSIRGDFAQRARRLRTRVRELAKQRLDGELNRKIAKLDADCSAKLSEALAKITSEAAEQASRFRSEALDLGLAIARKLTLDSPSETQRILVNEIRNHLENSPRAAPFNIYIGQQSFETVRKEIESPDLPQASALLDRNITGPRAVISSSQGTMEFDLIRRFNAIAVSLGSHSAP